MIYVYNFKRLRSRKPGTTYPPGKGYVLNVLYFFIKYLCVHQNHNKTTLILNLKIYPSDILIYTFLLHTFCFIYI